MSASIGQTDSCAGDGNAVAGVEEQRESAPCRLLAEVEQPLGHLVAREIGALDTSNPTLRKRRGYRLRIDRRVRQRRNVLVGAVTDDKGNTLVALAVPA